MSEEITHMRCTTVSNGILSLGVSASRDLTRTRTRITYYANRETGAFAPASKMRSRNPMCQSASPVSRYIHVPVIPAPEAPLTLRQGKRKY
jgi:hypothetical protein